MYIGFTEVTTLNCNDGISNLKTDETFFEAILRGISYPAVTNDNFISRQGPGLAPTDLQLIKNVCPLQPEPIIWGTKPYAPPSRSQYCANCDWINYGEAPDVTMWDLPNASPVPNPNILSCRMGNGVTQPPLDQPFKTFAHTDTVDAEEGQFVIGRESNLCAQGYYRSGTKEDGVAEANQLSIIPHFKTLQSKWWNPTINDILISCAMYDVVDNRTPNTFNLRIVLDPTILFAPDKAKGIQSNKRNLKSEDYEIDEEITFNTPTGQKIGLVKTVPAPMVADPSLLNGAAGPVQITTSNERTYTVKLVSDGSEVNVREVDIVTIVSQREFCQVLEYGDETVMLYRSKEFPHLFFADATANFVNHSPEFLSKFEIMKTGTRAELGK